ncbi:MAG: hypothetical protein IPJ03_08060 [Ignavibacteriales bacterium]|nr:hypothetical protein [Ignavibacteriales bacterium]
MKHLEALLGIFFLINTFQPMIIFAQEDQNFYTEELQRALDSRSNDENKISTTLFSQIFHYQKSIAEGNTVQSSMDYLSPELSFIDDQNRILILIRFNASSSTANIEQTKITISNSDGEIKSIGYGHNKLYEIYCWMPVDKIINLISNQGVEFLELIPKPVFRISK